VLVIPLRKKPFRLKTLTRFFQEALHKAPTRLDLLLLSIFTVLITFNPYYLNREIDIFELGLYLPGINAMFHGSLPYRDFFHLRGPLDLYMPFFLMKMTKPHLAVLCTYFYFGNVLCLIFSVLIAYELLKTRYMFYLMVPALIARTFPRVVFTYWGGIRYAFGLMAIWCFIKSVKSGRLRWMFGAGVATSLGLLTSIEIGIYALVGIITALLLGWFLKVNNLRSILKALGTYSLGVGIVIVPWVLYSMSQNAFIPYLNDTLTVIFKMQKIIDPHAASIYPHNFPEALAAMLIPWSINFKQMTPSYLYLGLAVYLFWRMNKRMFNTTDICLLALTIYGFIMYNTAFRGLWTAHFEMALMPEKILFFFLGEALVLFVWVSRERWRPMMGLVLLALFIISTGYSIARFNHRFFVFQIASDAVQNKRTLSLRHLGGKNKTLTIERARGMLVPGPQADELEAMVDFLKNHSNPQDIVVMFPELGAYNFLADRPFLGRFPITTFAWFDDHWFDDFLNQLKNGPVLYIFVQKKLTENWSPVYFAWKPNQYKYTQILSVIQKDYTVTGETPLCYIYARRSPSLAR